MVGLAGPAAVVSAFEVVVAQLAFGTRGKAAWVMSWLRTIRSERTKLSRSGSRAPSQATVSWVGGFRLHAAGETVLIAAAHTDEAF